MVTNDYRGYQKGVYVRFCPHFQIGNQLSTPKCPTHLQIVYSAAPAFFVSQRSWAWKFILEEKL